MNTDQTLVIRDDQQIASPSTCTDLQAGSVDKSESVCIFEGNFKNIDFYFDLRKLNAACKEASVGTRNSGSESGYAPPLKYKAVHHWPAPAVYSWPHSEDPSSDGPGFSGAAVHRFRHDHDWTSVCPEDLDTMLDRAIQAFIPDIKQEKYIVHPPICLGNETYIDVEVVNVAFFEDFYHINFACNGQVIEHEEACGQVEPGQVLLILTNLDPRVNPSEVAERIEIQLPEWWRSPTSSAFTRNSLCGRMARISSSGEQFMLWASITKIPISSRDASSWISAVSIMLEKRTEFAA